MLARLRALVVLLLLVTAGTVSLATPANADSCPSPYNYQFNITGLTISPKNTSSFVGSTVTFTVKVSGDADGQSNLTGLCVNYSVTGPTSEPTQHGTTDSAGVFTFQVTRTSAETDTVGADASGGTGGSSAADRTQHAWKVKPTQPPPTSASPKPSVTKSPSPTPSPTPKKTASPTPSPTASPTPSPTVSATPTATPTAAPTTPPTLGTIQLDTPSTLPGGSAALTGRNCPAGSTVSYTVEGTPAGSSTAGPDGTFGGNVQLPDTSIGEHEILVTCDGRTASVPIDLVVSSSSTGSPAAGATAAAVLVFFLLLGSVLFARNHGQRPPTAPTSEPG